MSSSRFNYGGNTFNSSETSRPNTQSSNPFANQQTSNPFADTQPAFQTGFAYPPGPTYPPTSGYQSAPAYNPRPAYQGPPYQSAPGFNPFSSYNPAPLITSAGPNYAQAAPHITQAAPVSNQAPNAIDDPYDFLRSYDIVFVIDDSGSMQGQRWNEVSEALKSITPICTARDADGIDIYFLNNTNVFRHVTNPGDVERIFNTVQPRGSTPIGTRLHSILRPYAQDLQRRIKKKPLNIIVITDGAATDDPESVIVDIARKLDVLDTDPSQVGIQFFQVGDDREATEVLKELDDALVEMGCKRDIVDTVPSKDRATTLSADLIMKTVLGGIVRRHDRKKAQ